jgi:hypothetical protein
LDVVMGQVREADVAAVDEATATIEADPLAREADRFRSPLGPRETWLGWLAGTARLKQDLGLPMVSVAGPEMGMPNDDAYVRLAAPGNGSPDAGTQVLAKPFVRNALASRIRGLIGR